MIITALSLPGVYLVELELQADARGHFARSFDSAQFQARQLVHAFTQHSVSYNHKRGTLRGMHYQAAPHGEVKLVRCTRGAVFDVVVDLREDSPTRGRWLSVELSADNGRAVYIPAYCAHGFITLQDHSELLYMIDVPYEPSAARCLRWDDPLLAVDWPLQPLVISERDATAPHFATMTTTTPTEP
ncbi:MAG: putative dTDP-4-dehydrorhamnose 3,5-epimerase [Pseudomonadota bacterium]